MDGGGYLARDLPDSLAILKPPPVPGSAGMRNDESARTRALAFTGTPRYALAASDADRGFPQTINAFACAFGSDITQERMPALYKLLVRMRVDARRAAYAAKGHYKRLPPFLAHHSHTCSRTEEDLVRKEGAYPSARSAVGTAYALVLAELRPDRTKALMDRAREFGFSRMICDVQWQSDVDAGAVVASAIVAQWRKDEAFRKDLAAARAEVAAATPSNAAGRSCEAEKLALRSSPVAGKTVALESSPKLGVSTHSPRKSGGESHHDASP
jgi:acid phosphatase (class A)